MLFTCPLKLRSQWCHQPARQNGHPVFPVAHDQQQPIEVEILDPETKRLEQLQAAAVKE
jgi:hypothetical protein